MKRSKQSPAYVFNNKKMVPRNRKAFRLEARRLGIKLQDEDQWGKRFFKEKVVKCEDNEDK